MTLAEQANADAIDSLSGFVAGSDLIVVTTDRGDHYLLDPDTLAVVGTLPASRGWFLDMALDAGEDRLLTIGGDDEIRLYDLGARVQLGVGFPFGSALFINNYEQHGLSLRPDGRQAAIAIPGGIAIWDLDPDHWVTAACQLASRNLTHEEWDTYIGDLAEYHATCPEFPAGV